MLPAEEMPSKKPDEAAKVSNPFFMLLDTKHNPTCNKFSIHHLLEKSLLENNPKFTSWDWSSNLHLPDTL